MANQTKILPATLLMVALFIAGTLEGAETVVPPEIHQRLNVLQSSYDSYLLQNVTLPFEKGLAALNQKVKPALQRAGDDAAQKKNLDALVLIKDDIKKIDSGGILSEAESPPPEPLKSIRATYKLELLKLEIARKAHLADARQRYDAGLAKVQDEMTSAQNVEAALNIKQLREKLMNSPDELLSAESSAAASTVAVINVDAEKMTFENGAMPFTNRLQDVFVLSQVPASLNGLSFFKTAGGSKEPRRVQIKSPGILYVACAQSENDKQLVKDQDQLAGLSFKNTGLKFVIYNTSLMIFSKEVSSSLTLPPPDAFCGFIVIGK